MKIFAFPTGDMSFPLYLFLFVVGMVAIVINEVIFGLRKQQLEIDRDETIKTAGDACMHVKSYSQHFKVGLMLLATLIICIPLLYVYTANNGLNNNAVNLPDWKFSLVRPAFAQSGATFLEQEAGMSIHINISSSISLSVAKTAFRVVEKETSSYIVGSVPLSESSPASEDAHCFVHKDGWIVVYYLKAEPVSKIVDWSYYSGGNLAKNKLQIALERVGNIIGVAVTGAQYYDFQYPLANKCMLIIKTQNGEGESSFNIKIPVEITVYEQSYSHYAEYSDYPYSQLKIDGNVISEIHYWDEIQTRHGKLSQLSSGVFHVVSVSGTNDNCLYHACIALVYLEP